LFLSHCQFSAKTSYNYIGVNYKHMMIVISDACSRSIIAFARVNNYAPRVINYAPRVTLQIVASLLRSS
jgi:hypothetical protein